MTNKLQNKIDELIKLEELHNIKEQYYQLTERDYDKQTTK